MLRQELQYLRVVRLRNIPTIVVRLRRVGIQREQQTDDIGPVLLNSPHQWRVAISISRIDRAPTSNQRFAYRSCVTAVTDRMVQN